MYVYLPIIIVSDHSIYFVFIEIKVKVHSKLKICPGGFQSLYLDKKSLTQDVLLSNIWMSFF